VKTILVVDDLPSNVDVVCNHLTLSGFRVLYAGNGARAIKQLGVTVPDLILLDVRMPGMDGLQTCRAIKANPVWVHVPIIFMTVADEIDQKRAAFQAGAVDYVTKPILPEEVEIRVRLHLQLREFQEELERKNEALRQEIELRVDAEEQLAGLLDQAYLIANPSEEIVFATRSARALLQAFFGELGQNGLPIPVREWLADQAGCTPLMVSAPGQGELRVEALAVSPNGTVALRLEPPNSPWGPRALLSLGLTPREAEVLYWICEGKTNPEIATILNASANTIKKHNQNLFVKLGVETRMAAARMAAEVMAILPRQ
jgi:DNA-binding NarL/FixJ family response regulator